MDISDVTAIFVNCCTLNCTRNLVEGLRREYPTLKFAIVDNGSYDESTEYIRQLGNQEGFKAILNEVNRGHGLGMDQAIRASNTRLCFVLDSDVIVLKGGFLEPMIRSFDEDPKLYAIGTKWKPVTSKRTREMMEAARKAGTHGINSYDGMLIDREKYLLLKPFKQHGSPTLHNQNEALAKGFVLGEFSTLEYLHHIGEQTIYALGIPFTAHKPADPRELRKLGIFQGEKNANRERN